MFKNLINKIKQFFINVDKNLEQNEKIITATIAQESTEITL
jgi:hypothetical protein